MKPHIFYDRGWRVGHDDRAIIASSLKGAINIATMLHRAQGDPKITGEAPRNTAQSPHPPFFVENRR